MSSTSIKCVTIAHSHYCECSRWMLQLLNQSKPSIKIDEAVFSMLPMAHGELAAVIRSQEPEDSPARLHRHKNSITVGGGFEKFPEDANIKRMDSSMVPVALVTSTSNDTNKVLGDSFEIMNYVCEELNIDSYTPEMQKKFDLYGSIARNLYYCSYSQKVETEATREEMIDFVSTNYFSFQSPDSQYVQTKKKMLDKGGAYEKIMSRFEKLWGVARYEETLKEKVKAIDDMFDYVESKLKDSEGDYLGGLTPSGDDYLFAALSCLLVCPSIPDSEGNVSDGKIIPGVSCRYADALKTFPTKIKAFAMHYRERPAGQHILKMYMKHRNCNINVNKTYQQTIEPKKEDFFKDCKL